MSSIPPPQEQLADLVATFADVATTDPLSALLLAVGGLVIVGSSAFVGYLAARGLVAGLTPTPARGPPRRAE